MEGGNVVPDIEARNRFEHREPTGKTKQLDLVLPGERDCDTSLIKKAVDDLNRLHSSMALEMACRMGEYVLRVFFNGDTKRFRERGRRHVSFRRLAERDDLQVSVSFLSTAVSVVEQLQLLPPAVARQLPLSHHRLLLPVKDKETKLELARWAADGHSSKRQLADRVRRYRLLSGDNRRGRPPTPPLIKTLRQLRKTAEQLLTVSGQEWFVGCYPDDETAALVDDLETELKAVVGIVRIVRNRLVTTPDFTRSR